MSNDTYKFLHEQHANNHNKYTYLLIAGAASAMMLSIQKTDNATLTWSLIPLALAMIAWGFSLYYGCESLVISNTAIAHNITLVELKLGKHPMQPTINQPELLNKAVATTTTALNTKLDKASFYAVMQWKLVMTGTAFFLAWHVIGIVSRTSFSTPPIFCKI